jgi:hypothetical protein
VTILIATMIGSQPEGSRRLLNAAEHETVLSPSELNALIDDPQTAEDIRERLIAQRAERGLNQTALPIRLTQETVTELDEPSAQRPSMSILARIRTYFRDE